MLMQNVGMTNKEYYGMLWHFLEGSIWTIGSLSSDVFERRTSTGSGLFALLSRNFDQSFGRIVSIRIKTLSNTNTVAPRLIKREKGSLPVDVRNVSPHATS